MEVLGGFPNKVNLSDGGPTFVFEKVAHFGAAGKDKLGDILDDLCLVLGRERYEPFCQALRGVNLVV